MKCLSRGDIQAFWDDELDPSKKADVTRHFRECPRCRILGDELRSNRELFQRKSSDLDLEIPRRILHAGKSARVRPWLFRPLPVPVSLLAFTLFVLVGMGALLFLQSHKLRELRLEQLAGKAQRVDSVVIAANVAGSLDIFGRRMGKMVSRDSNGLQDIAMIKEIKAMKNAKDSRHFFMQIFEQLKEV